MDGREGTRSRNRHRISRKQPAVAAVPLPLPLSLSLAAILFAFRRALIISDAMLFRLRWVYPFVDAIFHSGKIDIIFSLEFSAKFVRMRFGELDTALRLEEVRLRDHAT